MRKLHDIECYPNFWNTTVYDYDTGEMHIWEISDRKNDYEAIKQFYTDYTGFLISFNGIGYDSPVIFYMLECEWTSVQDLLDKVKRFSDICISNNRTNEEEALYKKYKYYKKKFIEIDLMAYWSLMLRKSKKISLKALGIQLGYHTIQELPFDPNTWLTSEEMDELINYNSVHDIGILKLLLEAPIYWQGKGTTFLQQIGLRDSIYRTYLPNHQIYSWDAPKIASELMLDFYSKVTQTPKLILRYSKEQGETLYLEDIEFIFPELQEVYEQMKLVLRNDDRTFKKRVNIIHNNTRLSLDFGIGGLHSVNNNEIYKSDEDSEVWTSDVRSLYPYLIINYKLIKQPQVLTQYIRIKDERVEAKKNKQKAKDVTMKLILNSTSGLLDNKYSWLYYPQGAMKMRLMGQLVLAKTIEELVLADFRVVSSNTDGIELIVPKSRKEEYQSIVDKVGDFFDLIFEHEKYESIYYSNVNNYLAVFDGGSTKQKGGTFITNPNIGDSCNSLIVPKALEAYFTKGVSIEEFIKGDHHIFDYCLSQKISKRLYDVYYLGKKQQQLNRYYVSKSGGILYKKKHTKTKMDNVLKGWGVKLYNNHTEDAVHDIDYRYYIQKARDVINTIQNNNQLNLF